MGNNTERTSGDQFLTRYVESVKVRALVQAIPYVGGPIDTLLAGHGSRIREQRLADFLQALDRRLLGIEGKQPNEEQAEGLHDLVLATMEEVVKSRSGEKRARFANMIARQILEQRPVEEAEAAHRLLGGIEELHLQVLLVANSAPICSNVFDGFQIVSLIASNEDAKRTVPPLYLWEALPGFSKAVLKMACAELVGRGLLHDEGVGRMDSHALEYFVITELGRWFLDWVSAPDR